MSIYSLVKLPRGSNISKTEIFKILLSIKDIENESERKEQWEAQLDTILDKGCNTDALIEITELIQEHGYCKSETSMYANSYTGCPARYIVPYTGGKRKKNQEENVL